MPCSIHLHVLSSQPVSVLRHPINQPAALTWTIRPRVSSLGLSFGLSCFQQGTALASVYVLISTVMERGENTSAGTPRWLACRRSRSGCRRPRRSRHYLPVILASILPQTSTTDYAQAADLHLLTSLAATTALPNVRVWSHPNHPPNPFKKALEMQRPRAFCHLHPAVRTSGRTSTRRMSSQRRAPSRTSRSPRRNRRRMTSPREHR